MSVRLNVGCNKCTKALFGEKRCNDYACPNFQFSHDFAKVFAEELRKLLMAKKVDRVYIDNGLELFCIELDKGDKEKE